jgi:hypothetical protein
MAAGEAIPAARIGDTAAAVVGIMFDWRRAATRVCFATPSYFL